jgi:hypothetical protein
VGQRLVVGLQHVLAMFGATVPVPTLMGFDPDTSVLLSRRIVTQFGRSSCSALRIGWVERVNGRGGRYSLREGEDQMAERRRIFVGSSSEAWDLAQLVGEVIERAGMEPVLWKTVFPAGNILLERIEQLAGWVDGAVLLATPDLVCDRTARRERFVAPVPNVVFEYGYLSARLSRKRVAICTFGEAEIPSDLQGLTVVEAGSHIEGGRLALRSEDEAELGRWLEGLVPLAPEIPPMRRVHGYSGTWDVQNRFTLWHGIELGENDTVFWDGKTLLCIRDDGEAGYGTQIGQLKVTLGHYRAKWDVANEVVRAAVDPDGSLRMRVKVCARTLIEETGTPPGRSANEGLPSPEWNLHLYPVPGEPRRLEGIHTFTVAGRPYSSALEYYTYADQ